MASITTTIIPSPPTADPPSGPALYTAVPPAMLTSLSNSSIPTTSPPSAGSSTCPPWEPVQSIVFQLASLFLLIAFLAPSTNDAAMLVTHSVLCLGFAIMAAWAWLYMCSPDIFAWSMAFAVLNVVHTVYLAYTMRPVRMTREQVDLYNQVFKAFKVPRHTFKQMCDLGKIYSLKIGEHYSEEGKTRCSRLSILVFGKVKVFCEGEFLHHILEKQFLDSPEWDSYEKNESNEIFQVTLTATTYCRYITWQRDQLQDFLSREPYLKQVFENLIGSDISKKLFLLTERNLNQHGGRADIRLPSAGRRPASNYDLTGHFAAGTRGACGAGIPLVNRTGDTRDGRSGTLPGKDGRGALAPV